MVKLDGQEIRLPNRQAELLKEILSGITNSDTLNNTLYGSNYSKNSLWRNVYNLKNSLKKYGWALEGKEVVLFRLKKL